MTEFIGSWGIYDGELLSLRQLEEPGKDIFSVYEVLRVEQSVPLFIEDHIDRLFHSLTLEQLEINESKADINNFVNRLIQKSQFIRGRIKLVYHFPDYPETIPYHFLIYFTPASFPAEELYSKGVHVSLCHAVRNDPNAKVLHTKAREQANEKIHKQHLFEVLLVNQENYITEGSRSNVFFISENKLVTPPDDSVLQGIARKNVIRLCRAHNLALEIRNVAVSELNSFSSVFLTGTSLKVLPVHRIDDIEYQVRGDFYRFIFSEFDGLIKAYINHANLPYA